VDGKSTAGTCSAQLNKKSFPAPWAFVKGMGMSHINVD
jgi:hypothetical protein